MRRAASGQQMNHGSWRERAYGEEQKPLCAWTLPAPALEAEPLGGAHAGSSRSYAERRA
jgi:hypothetical protein